jgi:beta-glucosidase/6-phospho-beta-glucosidase/beta-galactosidase
MNTTIFQRSSQRTGASFNNNEDTVINGKVNDVLRADYIKRHVAAALQAQHDGANLKGYTVWSGWDNFEWVFGYTKRFGIIHVDFNTQQRHPKAELLYLSIYFKRTEKIKFYEPGSRISMMLCCVALLYVLFKRI